MSGGSPRRDRTGTRVEVPRSLLVGLAALALAGALATAYLVGRLSSGSPLPPAAPPDAADAASASPLALPAAPDSSTVPRVPGAPAATGQALPDPPAPYEPAQPESGPGGRPAWETEHERLQVQRYFADLDALLQGQSFSGDPQALAQKLVQQAVSGDTSGLEELIAAQREATRALRAIDPPAACAEHHRRTLALAEQTLTLVQQVQAALAGGDTGLLLQLASVGREAEQEARELQALDRELRQAWGVPTPP